MNNLSTEQKEHVANKLSTEATIWLSTVGSDHRPHTVPIWFYWDETHIYFGSQDDAKKMRNIAAHPYATLALPDTRDVIIVEGNAEFVEPSEIGDVMAGYGKKYAKAMQAMGMNPGEREGFRLVRVTPQKYLVWNMTPSNNGTAVSEGSND